MANGFKPHSKKWFINRIGKPIFYDSLRNDRRLAIWVTDELRANYLFDYQNQTMTNYYNDSKKGY